MDSVSISFLLRTHSRPTQRAALLHILEPVQEETFHAFGSFGCMSVCRLSTRMELMRQGVLTNAIHPTVHIRQHPEAKPLQTEMFHVLHVLKPPVHEPPVKERRFPPIPHHHWRLHQQPIKTGKPIRRLRRGREPVLVDHRLSDTPREFLLVAATSRDGFAGARGDGISAFPAMI